LKEIRKAGRNNMKTAQDTFVQLNNYPPDKYNVLIPVTSMQVMSNMQRIIVNEVKLDTSPDGDDIYYDKQTGKYAITSVGGTKLAAAANISIVYNNGEQPDVCRKCVQMAKATGQAQTCGNCPRAYDVKHTVTVRVPEPSGGFRLITKSKEIDCQLEKASMSEAQFKRFLPHRASLAETKAYMRCLRSALGLAQGYRKQDLEKPFVVAHIVPNLNAPEMRAALINNSLRDMGLLFELPGAQERQETAGNQAPALSDGVMQPDSGAGQPDADDRYTEGEYPDTDSDALPWDTEPEPPQGIVCDGCGKEITEATGRNGQRWTPEAIRDFSTKRFGQCLCADCQKKTQGGNRR